jgi:hypothetical protein
MSRPPAEHNAMQAFKDGWDEYDFANLVATDPTWSALYTEHDSVEEYEASTFEADALDIICEPEFADHVLGYVYYRELWPAIPTRSSVHYRLTPYRHQEPPEGVVQAVQEQTDPLVEEGMLIRSDSYFRPGPNMPYGRFPVLTEEFEAFTHKFLKECGGEASIRNITLEYFQKDDPTPYEFWAGHKACFRLAMEGAVEREWTHLFAKKVESLGVIAARSELADVLNQADQNLGKKMRQANLSGQIRLRKPQQRGRWK